MTSGWPPHGVPMASLFAYWSKSTDSAMALLPTQRPRFRPAYGLKSTEACSWPQNQASTPSSTSAGNWLSNRVLTVGETSLDRLPGSCSDGTLKASTMYVDVN